MPFIDVFEVASAELIYQTPGGTAENILYFLNPSGWDVTELTNLAGELVDWATSHILLSQSVNVQLTSVKCTDLSTETGSQVVFSTGLPVAGDFNSPVLPSNATLAITFRTNTRGRSYRGRNYWIGLAEGNVVGDTVAPADVATIIGHYENLFDVASDNGWQWVVVSRYSGKNILTGKPEPRAHGISTAIVSVSSDGMVDSQRRRLAGRGS